MRVFERLSRARRLRNISRLRSIRTPPLIFSSRTCCDFNVNWESGALVGKRLVAMRSPSSRRSWIVFALSSIRVFVRSDIVVVDGAIESVRMLSVERRSVRSVYTKEAVCFVAPLISSFHWVSNGYAIGN